MKHVKSILFLGLIVLLTLGLVAPAAAQGEDQGPPRKIVVFKPEVADEAAQDAILKQAGAAKVKSLGLINAAAVRAVPAAEQALKAHPAVLRVDDDALIQALPEPGADSGNGWGPGGNPNKGPKQPPPQPAEILPWGVNRIDAELVWGTVDGGHDVTGDNAGGGVKVGVLDTGIDLDHPDLQLNIKGGFNTINPRKSYDDDNGHGTHVAGTIAAVDNTIGVIGVGPQIDLYAVKWLDRNGMGWMSDFIEALQWSVDNHIQVVNGSVGWGSDYQSVHDAIIAADNAGLVLVFAAGNSGPGDDTVSYPAKYQETIAVSATCGTTTDSTGWCPDGPDSLATFSSRGSEVDLAAPGAYVPSTWKDGGYYTASGTSMATPHVAGTAALVIASGIADSDHDGVTTNEEVRSRLQGTADNLGLPLEQQGYGLVDAQEAATGTQTLP